MYTNIIMHTHLLHLRWDICEQIVIWVHITCFYNVSASEDLLQAYSARHLVHKQTVHTLYTNRHLFCAWRISSRIKMYKCLIFGQEVDCSRFRLSATSLSTGFWRIDVWWMNPSTAFLNWREGQPGTHWSHSCCYLYVYAYSGYFVPVFELKQHIILKIAKELIGMTAFSLHIMLVLGLSALWGKNWAENTNWKRRCAHTFSLPTQVQRIYDYHRLLVQLYTITPKDHFDYHDLRFAVASVSAVSLYIVLEPANTHTTWLCIAYTSFVCTYQ